MESVPKELRNLRACLLCSLVKVGNFSERKTCLDFRILCISKYLGLRGNLAKEMYMVFMHCLISLLSL